MVDWQNEVKKRQDDLLADLKRLLRIKSVNDEAHATKDAPLGAGPAAALDEFLKIGQRDHFQTKNFDHLAGHIQLGDPQAEEIGMMVHVDEMPAGSGWKTDPFKPVEQDERIYGRGAFDDKGPAIAAYYAMKIVRDLGIPLKRQIKLIIGTDEEVDWRGIKHYFKLVPKPKIGFSPDQDFPVVNGEKGVANSWIKFPGANDSEAVLLKFESGERRNMVPRLASATLKIENPDQVSQEYTKFLETVPVQGESQQEGDQLILTLQGKAAHAQEPANGHNAATYLATFLQGLNLDQSGNKYISFIAKYLHRDSRMKKFKANRTSKIMGDLTVNAGVFNYDSQNGGQVTLNYRYPREVDPQWLFDKVKKVTNKFGATIKSRVDLTPHYVDPEDPMVKLMLDVYHRQTGLPAYGKTVGGGTFGRLLPNGVAFGARFPQTPSSIHQPNEFIPLHDLFAATAIYAEVLARLATTADDRSG